MKYASWRRLRSSFSFLLVIVALCLLASFNIVLLTSSSLIDPSQFLQETHMMSADATTSMSMESDVDGCGLVTNSERTQWRTYNAEDWELYNRVEQCIHWYDKGAYLSDYNSTNFRRLVCRQNIDVATILSTLQKYHTIYLLGDSVLQQQFIALMCTIDPLHENVDPIGKLDVHVKDWYFYNYSHPHGLTQFKFFKVGLLFDMEQTAFFETHFPASINASPANDAIVLHVGAHYRSGNAHYMMAALKYMSIRSFDSPAPIFLVEPNIEEWHTRNGLFASTPFENHSDCRPLTKERMRGRGHINADLAFNWRDAVDPLSSTVFHYLYPDVAYASLLGNATYKCYPDCTPQQWRLDLVRRQVVASNIHIVPVWWQVASLNLKHGIITARKPGDCIHKDISTLISLNDQLVRTMNTR
jgi:hypothetical protein